MATKPLLLLLAIALSLLASVAVGRQTAQYDLSQAQQCRLERLSASQPSQRIESEGGVTELWDENEDQFQCAGVAPMRNILRPNSLSLPNYHPAPRLVYIERGQGLLGVTFPGCAETFHSQGSSSSGSQEGRHEREQQEEEGRSSSSRRDQHQKIRRIRQGDIVALPPGVAHWTFNDGNEELIAVSINDLNHQANQLDQKLRAYYLAGGAPRQGGQSRQQAEETFQNIMRGFDPELMAEAFNVPLEMMKRMQSEDQRGLIVNVPEGMRMIRADEREDQEGERGYGRLGLISNGSNGLEETYCTMKLHHSVDERREADIYSKQAGRLNTVNQHKLPILRFMDMSAERGNLYPNALYTPHWTINSHCIVYLTRGEAQVQIVDHRGRTMMNDKVNQGEMFVVPQYFVATIRAGERDGVQWLTFKTNGSPMRSAAAGYTSVFRAMPLEVITNSFQISPSQAEGLKFNSGRQTYLASGTRMSRRSP